MRRQFLTRRNTTEVITRAREVLYLQLLGNRVYPLPHTDPLIFRPNTRYAQKHTQSVL